MKLNYKIASTHCNVIFHDFETDMAVFNVIRVRVFCRCVFVGRGEGRGGGDNKTFVVLRVAQHKICCAPDPQCWARPAALPNITDQEHNISYVGLREVQQMYSV